jgi:hypothetical protein
MSKRQRKAQRKRRNSAFKLRGLVGMFDSNNRDEKLSEIGDPLERLDAKIEWELFRPTLEQLYAGERKGPAGFPVHRSTRVSVSQSTDTTTCFGRTRRSCVAAVKSPSLFTVA